MCNRYLQKISDPIKSRYPISNQKNMSGKNIMLRVTESEHAAIQAIARVQNRTVTNMVYHMVSEAIRMPDTIPTNDMIDEYHDRVRYKHVERERYTRRPGRRCVNVLVRVDEQEKKQLQKIAVSMDRTITNLCYHVVKMAVERLAYDKQSDPRQSTLI